MVSHVYFTGQMFWINNLFVLWQQLLKKTQFFCTSHKSFRNLKRNRWNNLIFSALGTSDLNKFINIKILYMKLGKRETVPHNKMIGAFFWGKLQDHSTRLCLDEHHCSLVYLLTSKQCIDCKCKPNLRNCLEALHVDGVLWGNFETILGRLLKHQQL